MIFQTSIRVVPRDAVSNQRIIQVIANAQSIEAARIKDIRIVKRSIDARQRTVFINLTVKVFVDEECNEAMFQHIEYPDVTYAKQQAVVVGAGPGGLFAALRLIEGGIKPILIERGKNVHDRRRDIAKISRDHIVDPESNYSFGEGGAGAFSDGKLYTRSKKRGSNERILQILCQHGADTAILSDAHPHIGTDRLPIIIENMRNTILSHGGEVHFGTLVTGLIRKGDKIEGVKCSDGGTFIGPVVLATGHSARDVYRWLYTDGVIMESKGIAMGVRLEHPQQMIDQIQYHSPEGRGEYLPAAEYNFVTQVNGRGVYSFCMCPGGVVVPAASGLEQVVVNGMSASNRGSRWANSGMVVEIRPEDVTLPNEDRIMAILRFQERLEKECWTHGGKQQTAPAQRMSDFVNGRFSNSLPATSYTPGVVSSPLHEWMDERINHRLREGFRTFGKNAKGFLTNEALMIGMETRTSAPLRILRDRESLRHIQLEGLYPCGEGAGYAGGIVSAAIDGERCAESILSLN